MLMQLRCFRRLLPLQSLKPCARHCTNIAPNTPRSLPPPSAAIPMSSHITRCLLRTPKSGLYALIKNMDRRISLVSDYCPLHCFWLTRICCFDVHITWDFMDFAQDKYIQGVGDLLHWAQNCQTLYYVHYIPTKWCSKTLKLISGGRYHCYNLLLPFLGEAPALLVHVLN